MTVIFDGRAHAEPILENLTGRVRDLKDSYSVTPHLVTFMIGNPPGGKIYTERKKQTAARIGAKFTLVEFPDTVSINELIEAIEKFNDDNSVHGIMVQLPLPDSLHDFKADILDAIAPEKDVDGLSETGQFTHPTSLAILDILENSLITNPNTKILLIGSSGFVGNKTLQLISSHSFNIQGIDIETKDLKTETQKADIIISTTGTPNLIDQKIIKKGAYIIDIGYPMGDANPNVVPKAKFITPIKNGVGPVTIAYLLENLLNAAYNSITTHT